MSADPIPNDGRTTRRPAGLQRLIDRGLFPDVPVWMKDGPQLKRDEYARKHGLQCMIAYQYSYEKDGQARKVYAFLALETHADFHAAVHRCAQYCWSEDCPEEHREDAAFYEQLFGRVSPYIDIDLEADNASDSALRKVLAAAKLLDVPCGKLGTASTLVGTRLEDEGYKQSFHPIFSGAAAQPPPPDGASSDYPPRVLAAELATTCPGVDLTVYTPRRNFRVMGACKLGSGVPLVPRACIGKDGLFDRSAFHEWLTKTPPDSKKFRSFFVQRGDDEPDQLNWTPPPSAAAQKTGGVRVAGTTGARVAQLDTSLLPDAVRQALC